MINVSRVINSPRLAQKFTVYRKSGVWNAGRYSESETALSMIGVITVADPNDLEQIPEGDRQKGAISIHTSQPLQVTTQSGTSDEIEWRGNRYRAAQLFPYADYGYYKVIAVKMDPSTGVEA
ncbi:hypothetical protein [Alicyclobacillus suci]|uniref:hypothetical protein n=1 Tax=Alicyclobacillus suci TaxID=2816080 RepID=UPI001A8E8C98|nr:hypothetical protein [Alicyclobacillus suci]